MNWKTKIKILLLFIMLISFSFKCEEDNTQVESVEDCHCRKVYFQKQVVNYGFQYVYTHRGDWNNIDCSIIPNLTPQMNGYSWGDLQLVTPGVDEFAYRWECD